MNSNADRQQILMRLVPPVAAAVLLVTFVWLGMWQLERAAYKKELATSFASSSDYERIYGDMPLAAYQPIKSSGRYLGERQILIDNIVKDGRLGVYVITPFRYSADEPLLLVNRGWLPKDPGQAAPPDTKITGERLEIRGKAGDLPSVVIRPGEGFEGSGGWPRTAVFPTLAEVAAELDREVLPFVLLLDPAEASPMVRQWQPVQSGPATHYGYAFQWFALALAVLLVSIRQLRKRRTHGADGE